MLRVQCDGLGLCQPREELIPPQLGIIVLGRLEGLRQFALLGRNALDLRASRNRRLTRG